MILLHFTSIAGFISHYIWSPGASLSFAPQENMYRKFIYIINYTIIIISDSLYYDDNME